MTVQIPELDARALFDRTHADHAASLAMVRQAAMEIGFMTIRNTTIQTAEVTDLLDTYRRFFALPVQQKRIVDMATTGSNRGWGATGLEQVDPASNPDFKEVFDCGPELSPGDPLAKYTYYAPNRWPEKPDAFRDTVTRYYRHASQVSLALLSAVATAIDESPDYFENKFDKPMALLRGNYYPPRPAEASQHDFGIAPHTDYGCLTFLATDGSPGLEVQNRNGDWLPVTVSPGTFVVNFGEMLQAWTRSRVVATPHRVIGGAQERLSVPFFFNPRFDVDVAPMGSDDSLYAGEHLARRYDETYVHRRKSLGGTDCAR